MDTEPAKEIQAIEPIEKPLNSTSERNKQVLIDYQAGIPVKELVNKYKISDVRIYAIIKKQCSVNGINREYEKAKRLTVLERLSSKIPKNLVPDNVTDAVKVLEQQRKELEPEQQAGSTNTTNIQVNIDSINTMPTGALIDSIRKMLGQ